MDLTCPSSSSNYAQIVEVPISSTPSSLAVAAAAKLFVLAGADSPSPMHASRVPVLDSLWVQLL